MKRLLFLPLVLGLLTGCSGLPRPREMGDMALMRTMGVDAAEQELSVTVATGPRAKGLQGQPEPAVILTAQGESLSGAALSLQRQGEQYVFFGYVDQLLVGEELARTDLRPVLDYFARDRELGLGAQLWIVRENQAEQAIRSGGENGIEERLTTLRTDGELGIAAQVRTAGEVYADLLERGAAWLPALMVDEEGSVLTQQGYAILKEYALVGYLDGEAAKGMELLNGQPVQDILELETDSGQSVAVWISSASAKYRLTENALIVSSRISGQVAEYDRALTAREREEIRQQVQEREMARMEIAIKQLQEWQADCLGLGPKAGIGNPGLWQRLQDGWSTQFGKLEVQIAVELILPEPRIG